MLNYQSCPKRQHVFSFLSRFMIEENQQSTKEKLRVLHETIESQYNCFSVIRQERQAHAYSLNMIVNRI